MVAAEVGGIVRSIDPAAMNADQFSSTMVDDLAIGDFGPRRFSSLEPSPADPVARGVFAAPPHDIRVGAVVVVLADRRAGRGVGVSPVARAARTPVDSRPRSWRALGRVFS
jgi:hypothetical protein